MILDIYLQNDSYNLELIRVNAGITINYDTGVDKGKTILPTQVTVYGSEARKVYEAITSVINNTKITIKLTTDTGTVPIVEGFTNINSDVTYYYEQNVVSFSVTLYDKAVNLSYILNEKILTITNPNADKTFIISYSANQEVLVAIAVTGLGVCVMEIINIIKEIADISTASANPFAYHELIKIAPLIIKIVSIAPILYGIYDNIKEASSPNIIQTKCYRLFTIIQDVLNAFNYNVVISEAVLDKIKDLYFTEPVQVDIQELNRGLVKKIGNERIVPTTSLLDIFEFIKHYAGATIIAKDKTIYIEDKTLTTIPFTNTLLLDRINIESITPKKEYNNLRVFNYAIDPSNELSLSDKTSEKVFYSDDLYFKYINNIYTLNELDNGIYTYNSNFSITGTKDKLRKIEKVWDAFSNLFNKFISILNGAIDVLNSIVSGLVSGINKLITAINKLLKTKIKTISKPKPIPKLKKIDTIKKFIGYLQTETATFSNAIIFEGKLNISLDNSIAPTSTKKHLVTNTDKRNFIYERLSVKFPIPVKDVGNLNTYWYIKFDNGFETNKYLIERYTVNMNEGIAIVEADLVRNKQVLSEVYII